jgi:hypothetical protein
MSDAETNVISFPLMGAPEGKRAKRLTDSAHSDVLDDIAKRLRGLQLAFQGLWEDSEDKDAADGVLLIANDIFEEVEACAEAFRPSGNFGRRRSNANESESGAAKGVPKAHAGRPNNRSEIDKLLARYRFLEADQSYKAAVAATFEESNGAKSAHSKELDRIRDKLGV